MLINVPISFSFAIISHGPFQYQYIYIYIFFFFIQYINLFFIHVPFYSDHWSNSAIDSKENRIREICTSFLMFDRIGRIMSLTASLSMWFAVDCYKDQYHDPHNTYYQLTLYSLQDCCDECKIHKQITFSNCLPRTTDPKDDRVRFGHGNDFILNIQKTLEQTVQKQVKQTQIFVSQVLYLWAFLGSGFIMSLADIQLRLCKFSLHSFGRKALQCYVIQFWLLGGRK